MHSSATSYNATTLSPPQSYPIPQTTPPLNTETAWWARFNDPQLDQLIAVGLHDSPNLAVAESRVKKAQALTASARSTLWPSASFNGYVNRERYTGTSYYGTFGGQYFYQGGTIVNAQYDFDWWGKHRNQVAAQTSNTQAAKAELANAQLILSAEIANSYFLLQSNIAQLNISTKLLQIQQQINAITEARMTHGVDSGIPITVTASDVQSAQIAVLQNQQIVELERHKLAVLMGKNPFNTTIAIPSFAYYAQQLTLPKQLPLSFIARRPDVTASLWQVEAAADEVKVSKAGFYPDINLVAFYSYQSIGLNNLFDQNSRNILVQPAVSLPLFDAGLHRADLSARYADYDTAVNQYNETILTALRQVSDQISLIRSVQTQLSAQNSIVNATRHNFMLTNAQYKNGITDYMKVLEIQSNLLTQQLYQLQLQTQHIEHVINMIQALGGGYPMASENKNDRA